MSKDYPYIQNKETIEIGTCSVCKQDKKILRIEWRVDWFQGNCEFEDICQSCIDKRTQEALIRQKRYEQKMAPIWAKQREKEQQREDRLNKVLEENNVTVKKYDNGQWTLNNIIDWWTTTGTAIHRKTKERYHFSEDRPEEIVKVLSMLK